MPSVLLLWMIAIEQLIHRPINWDRVWHLEIIASTGDCAGKADKQKTSAAGDDSVWTRIRASGTSGPASAETASLALCVLETFSGEKKYRYGRMLISLLGSFKVPF